MLVCLCIVYHYDGAQWYKEFIQIGWLDRALILLGLYSDHLCIFGLYGAVCI